MTPQSATQKAKEQWIGTLDVNERVWLFNILPRQGDIRTMRTVKKLRGMIQPTKAEIVTLQQEQGKANLNPEYQMNLAKMDVNFDDKELELIEATLARLSTQNQLSIECIDLYDKFVKEK